MNFWLFGVGIRVTLKTWALQRFAAHMLPFDMNACGLQINVEHKHWFK